MARGKLHPRIWHRLCGVKTLPLAWRHFGFYPSMSIRLTHSIIAAKAVPLAACIADNHIGGNAGRAQSRGHGHGVMAAIAAFGGEEKSVQFLAVSPLEARWRQRIAIATRAKPLQQLGDKGLARASFLIGLARPSGQFFLPVDARLADLARRKRRIQGAAQGHLLAQNGGGFDRHKFALRVQHGLGVNGALGRHAQDRMPFGSGGGMAKSIVYWARQLAQFGGEIWQAARQIGARVAQPTRALHRGQNMHAPI